MAVEVHVPNVPRGESSHQVLVNGKPMGHLVRGCWFGNVSLEWWVKHDRHVVPRSIQHDLLAVEAWIARKALLYLQR